MQYDDDIAFQRAILANPADTTLKLVYADWLQERDDPREHYVRRQLEMLPWKEVDSPPEWEERRKQTSVLEPLYDPGWVGFMKSLAQPFAPGVCLKGDPFIDRIGLRGDVAVFELQYCAPDALNDGLLADLAFLTSAGWGICAYGQVEGELHGFVCDLRTDRDPLAPSDIRAALQVAVFGRDGTFRGDHSRIGTTLGDQFMFTHPWDGEVEHTHVRLADYVTGGRLWYLVVPLERSSGSEGFRYEAAVAVGHSPHGNRLVGVFTCREDVVYH